MGGAQSTRRNYESLLSLAVGTVTTLSLGIVAQAQQYSQTNLVL
jgi:hypothetical protein